MIVFKNRKTQKLYSVDFCEPQLNLLAHAQAIELEIGSQCGGHGICGRDRIGIPLAAQSSFSPLTDEERALLSSADLEAGVRLACQCFPNQVSASAVEIEFNL